MKKYQEEPKKNKINPARMSQVAGMASGTVGPGGKPVKMEEVAIKAVPITKGKAMAEVSGLGEVPLEDIESLRLKYPQLKFPTPEQAGSRKVGSTSIMPRYTGDVADQIIRLLKKK